MSTRHAEIHRTTAETDVVVSMELDGSGTSHIDTGIGFFDHMLTLFAAHARVDLTLRVMEISRSMDIIRWRISASA